MDPHGQTIVEIFPPDHGGWAGELKLARDHVLGEIALADEVRDDVNVIGIDQVESLSKGGLLFPKAAVDFAEKIAAADLIGMVEIRGGRIRILGGTVADDEQGAVRLRGDGGHAEKVARFSENARFGQVRNLRFEISDLRIQSGRGWRVFAK